MKHLPIVVKMELQMKAEFKNNIPFTIHFIGTLTDYAEQQTVNNNSLVFLSDYRSVFTVTLQAFYNLVNCF